MQRSWFSHSSDCSATTSLVVAAAVLRDLYSLASTFSFLWISFFDLLVDFSMSQCSLSGYKYWISHSMFDFGVRSLTTRMTSSLPLYNYSTIPMLHFPLFYSSPLIKATSPTSIFISLCIILCLSFPHRLFTLNVGFFSFLEYLHLAVLLESL